MSVCPCVSISFFCSHALSCRCQSSPVQWKTERKTLNHAVPLKRPHLHHGPTWCVIAGFVIAFQSLFSHYLITTQTAWWEDRVLSWGAFIIVAFKNLLYSVVPHLFTSFLIRPPRPSPLFISPISASCSPLFPSLFHIPRWVGGKFNGDVGSQKGSGGLPLTRAQYVCKSGSSYQPVRSVSSGGWLLGGVFWGCERSKICPG